MAVVYTMLMLPGGRNSRDMEFNALNRVIAAGADDVDGCGVTDADSIRFESCDGEFNALNRVIADDAAMGCCGPP